jgi:hypothetical protein
MVEPKIGATSRNPILISYTWHAPGGYNRAHGRDNHSFIVHGRDMREALIVHKLLPLSARRCIAMLGLLFKVAHRQAHPDFNELFPQTSPPIRLSSRMHKIPCPPIARSMLWKPPTRHVQIGVWVGAFVKYIATPCCEMQGSSSIPTCFDTGRNTIM